MECLQKATPWVAGLLVALTPEGFGQSGDVKGGAKPAQAAAAAEAKASPAAPTDSTAESKPASQQVWEGKLAVGAGLSLRIVVHVSRMADGKIRATMDSPDQGAKGLKIDSITLDKAALAFQMNSISGKYEGKLNAEGTEAQGTWSQLGMSLPLTLKKTAKPTELRRPQTPTPPFPYKLIEVTYPNKAGAVTLAGTLTEPRRFWAVPGGDPH